MQRKIFDPEHAKKQQIWQLAEKEKIIHTKAFSPCPSPADTAARTNPESQMKLH